MRVLIADDNPSFRTFLRQTLEVERDLSVVGEAADAEEAAPVSKADGVAHDKRDECGFGIADALRDAVATIVACSISSASFGETLVGYRGPSGEQIDEVANRCEVGSQCFAGAFVERSDWPLDGLAGDYFDFFVFHFAFSCEAIWFLQPEQRNQSPSPQGNAEVYEAGAEGNGRDRSGVHLARPVLADAVWVK